MSSPKSVESFTGSDTAADTSLERVFDCDMEENNEGRKQVEETQFVDVDIDTQGTTGDNRRGVAHSPQPVSPALSMMAKSKQFSFSLDDDDDAPAFAFGKAMIKTPAISLPRKGADQARAPAKEVAHAPTIDNDHARELPGIHTKIKMLQLTFPSSQDLASEACREGHSGASATLSAKTRKACAIIQQRLKPPDVDGYQTAWRRWRCNQTFPGNAHGSYDVDCG